MKVFVVNYITFTNGGIEDWNTYGIYSTIEQATNEMDNLFHKLCNEFNVKELGKYDHYTKSRDFHVEERLFAYEIDGKIIEKELTF